ncbi:FACT complex subunit SSRP1 [Aphelenchoides fujianensis]|nr:FACT complex subunit SSRP1 [Aphelenchoides fujianensis]
MSQNQLEYRNVAREDYGMMAQGSIRIAPEHVKYQSRVTGKVFTVNADDIEDVFWLRMGNMNGLKVVTKQGVLHRFAGMPDSDPKIQSFVKQHWHKDLERQEQSIKGWNYGEAQVEGQTLVFRVDEKVAFEIPLTNVAQCPTGGQKSEVTLEFHPNEDAPVQLCELRLHKPAGGEDGDAEDMVEQFRQQVMRYVEGETDLPIVTLKEVLCATPRGRYDIKVYANRLAFPRQIVRLQDPLQHDLPHVPAAAQGPAARIFRILTNVLITVPADMDRETMSCTVFSCAFRQASGYLYPLEKGFMYVHKPPMYVRFDEIDNVHFARSDASTRSFDFEIVQKSGTTINFSSIAKEEYNKLFDFVEKKRLKVRNAKRLDHKTYKEDAFAGSDEELDPYKEKLKEDANSGRTRRTPRTTTSTYDSAASDVSDDLVESGKKEKRKAEKKDKKEKKSKAPKEPKDGEPKRKRKSKAAETSSPTKKAISREFIDEEDSSDNSD